MSNIPYLRQLDDNSTVIAKDLTAMATALSTIPASPYKVYTALLTQTGTNNPVANVLQNTIGTVTVSRTGVGVYNIECPNFNFFTLNKTAVCAIPTNTSIFRYKIYILNPTNFSISTYSSSGSSQSAVSGDVADDLLYNTMVEIRVYN